MTKKTALAALVLLTLTLASAPAFAGNATGYVCTMALQPATQSQSNGIGTEGDLLLILNSQPDCGGTQVAYVFLFSIGATYPGVNPTYLYTASELQAIYQSLVTARNKSVQRTVGLGLATTNPLQILTVSMQ